VLLLAEPTNNLDADARHRLYDALDDFTGCLLLVSHDRMLLDRMDRIAELHDGQMLFHGGGFTAYERAVSEAQRVAENDVRNAEQQLKRERRDMQQARERGAKRSITAARNVKDAGLPKIVAGALKRRAQESAGRIDGVNAARVDDAKARLDEAERRVRDDDALALDLPDTHVPAGRTVLAATDLQVDGLFTGVDLDIRGPQRIALTGRTARVSRHFCASPPASCSPMTAPSNGQTDASPICRSDSTCWIRSALSPRTSRRSRRACRTPAACTC